MQIFRIVSRFLSRMGLDYDNATLRDAARLSIQSAIAAMVSYIVIRAIGSDEAFVAILSAVLILQPSVGGTIDAARTRIAASVIGSLIGLVSLIVLPTGFGTAFALLFTMLIINAFAQLKPEWSYGVVAAVALSIADTEDLTTASITRLVAIALGVATGLIVSATIWPDTATARFERHLSAALRHMADAMRNVSEKAPQEKPDTDIKGHQAARDSLRSAREVNEAAKMADHGAMTQRLQAADAASDAIWLLNSIMQRTEDLRQTPLEEPLAPISKLGGDVLDALADGELIHDQISNLSKAIDRVVTTCRDATMTDARGGDQAEVIAFAFGTLLDQMRGVADSQPDPTHQTPTWAERVRLRRRSL
ncbi:MAG: FUSC family protein [Jannaschia helgolandensis]